MKLFQIIAFALIAIVFSPVQTLANNDRALEQLTSLNRMNPLQNPEFDRAGKILGRKILDRKNKVVGRVDDVIVNSNGTIASLQTDFDRLRLGTDLYLNYRSLNIRTRSTSYALGMDADEIEDFYPQLLADIETASGNNTSTFSVREMMGAPILSDKGRKIGKVKNVLFANNGGIVRALYAEFTSGILRGRTIAIPFRSANLQVKKNRITAVIDEEFADSMAKAAENN